jgi:membrane-associated phospholipid phosphatase
MVLPLFLTRRNKYVLSILWLASGAAFYLSTNHYYMYPPQFLPMTRIDQAVPFVPWTIWIYNSEFFLFFSAFFLSADLVNANKYLYSFLSAQILSTLVFIFWPTTYPREQFPLPADIDSITRALFANLRGVDSPANCFPSMHVCGVYVSAFLFIDEQRKKLIPYFLWATAIAFSTLTTKQHYLADVVSGFLLACALWFVFHRLARYRQP